jgi:CYTH domain-containing protein
MNKTAQTELHRAFLVERLPEPLTAASSHLQIFDNYIEGTRMRLRQVRDPYSNTWTRMLQQRFPIVDGEYAVTKLAEIHLNDDEYGVFQQFEGREIRKNRYFHEFDAVSFAFDVYLGRLSGLHTARVDFEERGRMEDFIAPPFAVFEITNNQLLAGDNLVDKDFADVRLELAHPFSAS